MHGVLNTAFNMPVGVTIGIVSPYANCPGAIVIAIYLRFLQ